MITASHQIGVVIFFYYGIVINDFLRLFQVKTGISEIDIDTFYHPIKIFYRLSLGNPRFLLLSLQYQNKTNSNFKTK